MQFIVLSNWNIILLNLISYYLQASGKIKAVFSHKAGEVIVDTAKEENAQYIVMGTRGLGSVRRTLMGSVSDYVVHHAKCPVMICRDS